jgi:hypothetical protein
VTEIIKYMVHIFAIIINILIFCKENTVGCGKCNIHMDTAQVSRIMSWHKAFGVYAYY